MNANKNNISKTRVLAPQAQRALAEARERQQKKISNKDKTPKEVNGRGGLDPVRYGDWEVKGIAYDF